MRCPYDSPEKNMEQGCAVPTTAPATTVTPLPELIVEPTFPDRAVTGGDQAIVEQVIETDVSVPPAIEVRELAWTGFSPETALGGTLAIIAGVVLVRAQRRFTR